MQFYSRRMIKPEDLNPASTLFGGTLLRWIDEDAAIFATCQLGKKKIVTKFMSEINFVSPGRNGDIIEMGFETLKFGRTSITVKCVVRNKLTYDTIITIEKIVFVHIDDQGKPEPHGVTVPPVI